MKYLIVLSVVVAITVYLLISKNTKQHNKH